jgi:hypothetical protein
MRFLRRGNGVGDERDDGRERDDTPTPFLYAARKNGREKSAGLLLMKVLEIDTRREMCALLF